MRASNVNQPGERSHGIVRGHVGLGRAGSTGVDVADQQGNAIADATRLELVGLMASQGATPRSAVLTATGTGQQALNASGGDLVYGDIVVLDSDGTVTTTTTAQDTRPVGVVQIGGQDDALVSVVFSGYVAQANTTGTVTAGDYLESSTSAGDAKSGGTIRRTGSFALALGANPNPPAILFGVPDSGESTAGGGGGGWDSVLTKTSDQGVTNSSTLVAATDLQFSIASGEVWRIECEIVYTSDATGDFKGIVASANGNGVFWSRVIGTDNPTNGLLLSTGQRDATGTGLTAQGGGGSTAILRHFLYECVVKDTGATTVRFMFAQLTTTAGQTATCKAGSLMRLKKLV